MYCATNTAASSSVALDELLARCTSTRVCDLVRFLHEHHLTLPTSVGEPVEGVVARPDLVFRCVGAAAVFVEDDTIGDDSPGRDVAAEDRLIDAGWAVVRVAVDAQWHDVVAERPDVFGERRARS